MRTAEEIRERLLGTLDAAVRRPLMYGGADACVQIVLWNLVDALCFIDERDAEAAAIRDNLARRGLFCSTGIVGAFRGRIRNVDDFSSEVASVWAELADRFGYLKLARRLEAGEWRRLRAGLRCLCQTTDLTARDVRERFGEPSLVSLSVYSYAPREPGAQWVHFDFFDPGGTYGRRAEYRLRDARLPASTLSRSLVFTPFGARFRRPR